MGNNLRIIYFVTILHVVLLNVCCLRNFDIKDALPRLKFRNTARPYTPYRLALITLYYVNVGRLVDAVSYVSRQETASDGAAGQTKNTQ